MQTSALCRFQRELPNAYFLAKFGLDTAENEPCQVCPIPRNAAAARSVEARTSALSGQVRASGSSARCPSWHKRVCATTSILGCERIWLNLNFGAYLLAKIGFDTAENGPHRFQKSTEWDTAIISAVAFFYQAQASSRRGSSKFVGAHLRISGMALIFSPKSRPLFVNLVRQLLHTVNQAVSNKTKMTANPRFVLVRHLHSTPS